MIYGYVVNDGKGINGLHQGECPAVKYWLLTPADKLNQVLL